MKAYEYSICLHTSFHDLSFIDFFLFGVDVNNESWCRCPEIGFHFHNYDV